jgi:hypothetical protein
MTDSSRHLPRWRTRLLATLIGSIAAVVAALGIPSAAGAVTLGSTHISRNSQGAAFCGGFPTCGYVQTALPGATTRAPFGGRIREWNVHLEDPGSLQLLVVRKQANGNFKALAASSVRTPTTDGVKTFGANLPIHKGDFVGLNLLDENSFVETLDATGAPLQFFTPAFDVGTAQQPYAPFFNSTEFLFNAKLKH